MENGQTAGSKLGHKGSNKLSCGEEGTALRNSGRAVPVLKWPTLRGERGQYWM